VPALPPTFVFGRLPPLPGSEPGSTSGLWLLQHHESTATASKTPEEHDPYDMWLSLEKTK